MATRRRCRRNFAGFRVPARIRLRRDDDEARDDAVRTMESVTLTGEARADVVGPPEGLRMPACWFTLWLYCFAYSGMPH